MIYKFTLKKINNTINSTYARQVMGLNKIIKKID